MHCVRSFAVIARRKGMAHLAVLLSCVSPIFLRPSVCSGPTTVLVLSLLFIAFVVLLHVRISPRLRHSPSAIPHGRLYFMRFAFAQLMTDIDCCAMFSDLGQIPEGMITRSPCT